MDRLIPALIALFIASQVQAQSLPRLALYASTAADLATTEFALHQGFTEANPILSQSRIQRISICAGATFALDLSARWFQRNGHRRAASILLWSVTGAHIGASVWNGVARGPVYGR